MATVEKTEKQTVVTRLQASWRTSARVLVWFVLAAMIATLAPMPFAPIGAALIVVLVWEFARKR